MSSVTPTQIQPRLRLRVTAAAESKLRAGHPWVFADSVREQNREARMGELGIVYDRKDRFLAIGLWDPDSPIRLRVLHQGSPTQIDALWWQEHLKAALQRREGLFDSQTNGYRVIHGENDGWPGLVLDRYDATFVLKCYTASWMPYLEELQLLFYQQLPMERLVLRLARNIQEAVLSFGRKEGDVLIGTPPSEPVVFLETGLRFQADVLRGQKTGFFLDQRESRRWVEAQSRGRTVLNAFSFTGGFSLYAARGGARAVTDLDISAHALASARDNFQINAEAPNVARCSYHQIQADAFEWLKDAGTNRYDLVILDPPSLAKRESERQGAIQAYERLARLGWERLLPGGILLACSCSAHVSELEFRGAVQRGVQRSGPPMQELYQAQHAPDHPVHFPEGAYLKVGAWRK